MSGCERVKPYLTSFGANELSPATTAWVASHTRDCAGCSATARRLTEVSEAVRALPGDAFEAPADFAGAVIARIAERETHAARRMVPIAPLAPDQLGRIPSEVGRVLSDNRDAILSGAATAAVAATAAWLAWRAIRSTRRPDPA